MVDERLTDEEKLEELLEYTGFKSEKTVDFVDSIARQVEGGEQMSEGQRRRIREIYEENFG